MKAKNLLDLIEDGEWHSVNDLAKKIKAPLNELINILKALSECKVIEHKEKIDNIDVNLYIFYI